MRLTGAHLRGNYGQRSAPISAPRPAKSTTRARRGARAPTSVDISAPVLVRAASPAASVPVSAAPPAAPVFVSTAPTAAPVSVSATPTAAPVSVKAALPSPTETPLHSSKSGDQILDEHRGSTTPIARRLHEKPACPLRTPPPSSESISSSQDCRKKGSAPLSTENVTSYIDHMRGAVTTPQEMDDQDYRHNITVQYCFPDNNSSCIKEVNGGPVYFLLCFFLSCIVVCTVCLNLLVIISISHFKQLHTPTNLIILSLAVADFFVGLVNMPVDLSTLMDSCWYLGTLACYIYLMISFVSIYASLYSVILIAVDRYIAITNPLQYSSQITLQKTLLSIILGWSFLAIHQAKAVRAVKNGASNTHGAKTPRASEIKAAKKLGTVVFVFLACWIAFFVWPLTVHASTTVSILLTLLIDMNSFVNPLMYAIFYPWFRTSAKYIITCSIFQSSSSRLNFFIEH
ncbi:trace amine-associated receptor 13c-like [Hoplias malabaricus]|uniref:trace amine-associated receptor 13c-like n=1 Tax=Hoplias malabaricus TaxID=27720 RepID=UPI00346334C6